MTALKQRAPEPALQEEPCGVACEPGMDRADLAVYIAQLTGQLAAMARDQRLDLLAYFLDMARIEAATQAGRDRAA